MGEKDRHQHFELRRQSAELVYTFTRKSSPDGSLGYQRSDGDYWIVYRPNYGWVAWNFDTQSIAGRPWEVLPDKQLDYPPEGIWVSRKGPKSYVYTLIYV